MLTPAQELLRQYHAAKDNGDTALAQRLWREYWDLCAVERVTQRTKEAAGC